MVLKYLSKFWRLLEMLLINCKAELKIKRATHCVLLGNDNDNDYANFDNNNIFTIKGTGLYTPVVTLLARDNQSLAKLLSGGFERSVYWNEYKTKCENQNTTNEYKYFLESNLAGADCLLWVIQIKMTFQKDIKPNYIIFQNVLPKTITSLSMEKIYDQPHRFRLKTIWRRYIVHNRTRRRLYYMMFVKLWILQKVL